MTFSTDFSNLKKVWNCSFHSGITFSQLNTFGRRLVSFGVSRVGVQQLNHLQKSRVFLFFFYMKNENVEEKIKPTGAVPRNHIVMPVKILDLPKC